MNNSIREGGPAAPRPVWRWVVRQTAIGLLLLAVFVVSGAWLLNAGIDPDSEQSIPSAVPDSAE